MYSESRTRNEFISLLSQECVIYAKILEIAQEKTSALVENDTPRIAKLTQRLQVNLEQLEGLEIKRKALVEEIAEEHHMPVSSVTLRALASLWKEPRLEEMRAAIRDILGALQKLNKRNTALLSQAQGVVSFVTELLYSTLEQGKGYNAQGQVEKTQGGYFEGKI